MNASTNILEIKGIGVKSAKLYSKLNIYNVSDLIHYFPKDYESFYDPICIQDAKENEINSYYCKIDSSVTVKKIRNLTIANLKISDCTGSILITFFNMPFLKNIFKKGDAYVFRGILKNNKMEQPKFYARENYEKLCKKIQPFYSTTKGLTNNQIKKAIHIVLNEFDYNKDGLPDWVLKSYHIMPYKTAIQTLHFPSSESELMKARRSMVFREFLSLLYLIKINKLEKSKIRSPYPMIETSEIRRLVESLPYKLTDGQFVALNDITEDMTNGFLMSRLIQGDVGSGKTILSILSLLLCVSNGYQGVLMAPTEVLAEQHYHTIVELTKDYNLSFSTILLTGSLSGKEKKEAYEKIRSGQVNVIIGTQALIQKKVEYKNLALVITDEQHRFGVRQREFLAKKGSLPHVLVMSATPIPRSLALILYNDLDISIIKDRPAERMPIKNCVVNSNYRNTAYKFMEKEISNNHQIYIICPMAEESNSESFSDKENVIEYTEQLKSIFPPTIQITYLHGKMKPANKRQIMEDFYNKNIDILVSTTVIEVGINVPNATVMMIENAECFGLAQLHQLRGRIGRGKSQSYCIFINTSNNKDTLNRLEILNHSNDGFHIAEEDLKLRGPGDLWGIQQSGDFKFKIADIYRDSSVLKEARDCIDKLYEIDAISLKSVYNSLIEELNIQRENHLDFQTI